MCLSGRNKSRDVGSTERACSMDWPMLVPNTSAGLTCHHPSLLDLQCSFQSTNHSLSLTALPATRGHGIATPRSSRIIRVLLKRQPAFSSSFLLKVPKTHLTKKKTVPSSSHMVNFIVWVKHKGLSKPCPCTCCS